MNARLIKSISLLWLLPLAGPGDERVAGTPPAPKLPMLPQRPQLVLSHARLIMRDNKALDEVYDTVL